MAKAQQRQTGAGPHGDRRLRRNRDRQAQERSALADQLDSEDRTYPGPVTQKVLGEWDW